MNCPKCPCLLIHSATHPRIHPYPFVSTDQNACSRTPSPSRPVALQRRSVPLSSSSALQRRATAVLRATSAPPSSSTGRAMEAALELPSAGSPRSPALAPNSTAPATVQPPDSTARGSEASQHRLSLISNSDHPAPPRPPAASSALCRRRLAPPRRALAGPWAPRTRV
jgi:hypothetical protein